MKNLEIRLKGFGVKKNEANNEERRVATKRERILYYSKVFIDEAEDRRINLTDRRRS